MAISIAAVLAALGLTTCASGDERAVDREHALAAVLGSEGGRGYVSVIDLERRAVVQRMPLRSVALAVDADATTGRFVTAQSGQPHRHDSACGLLDPITGRIRYLKTGEVNPVDVVALDGLLYVLHGLEESGGLVLTVVDARPSGGLARKGYVSTRALGLHEDGSEVILSAAGAPLGEAHPAESAEAALWRLDLTAKPSLSSTGLARAVTVLGRHDGDVLVAGQHAEREGWFLARVSDGEPRWNMVGEVPDVSYGLFAGCVWGDEVVVADSDAENPDDPGRGLLVLSARDGRLVRRMSVSGRPAHLETWEDELLVLDPDAGQLLMYRHGEATPHARVSYARAASPIAGLAVLESASGIEGK